MTNQAHFRRDTTVYEDRPLPPQRLAAIWHSLPERERFGFILALDERLADQVIVLTCETKGGADDRRS